MGVIIQRRDKRETTSHRPQQALSRTQSNRKRITESEYWVALEKVEVKKRPPPLAMPPSSRRHHGSDNLFTHSREFEERNREAPKMKDPRLKKKEREKREKETQEQPMPVLPHILRGYFDLSPSESTEPDSSYQAQPNKRRSHLDERELWGSRSFSRSPSLSRIGASHVRDISEEPRLHSGQSRNTTERSERPNKGSNNLNSRSAPKGERGRSSSPIPPAKSLATNHTRLGRDSDRDRRNGKVLDLSVYQTPTSSKPKPPAKDVRKPASDESRPYPSRTRAANPTLDGLSSTQPAVPGSLGSSVDRLKSRAPKMSEHRVKETPDIKQKDRGKHSGKGREHVRVEKPSSLHRSAKEGPSSRELQASLYTQDSRLVSEDSKDQRQSKSIPNSPDEIIETLYLDVESMLADMNEWDTPFAAHRTGPYVDEQTEHKQSEDFDENYDANWHDTGLVVLEDMPGRLRDIMLSRERSALGLDVDIGSKNAILHVDVMTAFQAMRDDGPSLSPGEFDFGNDEDYSEGLVATGLGRNVSVAPSVFHW